MFKRLQSGGNINPARSESTRITIPVRPNIPPSFNTHDSLRSTSPFKSDKRTKGQIITDRANAANSFLSKASAIGELFPATRVPATALGMVLGANAVNDDIQTGQNGDLAIDLMGMLPGLSLSSGLNLPAKQAAKYTKAALLMNAPKIIGTAGDLTDNGKDFGLDPNKKQEGGEFKDGGIHIKSSNKGKFTQYKKRTGKSTEEALHSKDPHVRKMANFAKNAKKFKHQEGGMMEDEEDSLYDDYDNDYEQFQQGGISQGFIPFRPTQIDEKARKKGGFVRLTKNR